MNSAQRRQTRRVHRYVITIYTEINHPYYEHDEKVSNAIKWCKKHCKGTWRSYTDWDHADFKFTNHKDATIFGLKWI